MMYCLTHAHPLGVESKKRSLIRRDREGNEQGGLALFSMAGAVARRAGESVKPESATFAQDFDEINCYDCLLSLPGLDR
jgi:hypothetical protein